MKLTRFSCFFLLLATLAAGLFLYDIPLTLTPEPVPCRLPEKVVQIPAQAGASDKSENTHAEDSDKSGNTSQSTSSGKSEGTNTGMAASSLNARYACVMDADSGRILWEKDAGHKAAMASTTKIMTSLLVLESGRLDETVTASQRAASMPKVHLGMAAGYQFSMKDLLYSLMLESHNDTAVAIAEHMAGSVENFAKKMNQKAKSLHMENTHFVTPNGLDAEGHYSTAADMCRLAAYAIKNKDFLELIQTRSHSFSTTDGKHSYTAVNRDAFLSYYDGALGVKTGFTGDAGYCFVGAAKKKGVTLVSCVLACGWPPNKNYKWTDTRRLMDYGFENFTASDLPLQKLEDAVIPVEDGKEKTVSCLPLAPPKTLLSRSDSITVTYELPEKLHAPVRSGAAIGTVSWYINDDLFCRQEIFPSKDIEKSGFSDKIRDVLQVWTRTLFREM